MSDIYYKITVPRDEHEDQLSRERVDRWIFIVMLITIAIVPLLVGGHVAEFVSPLITEKVCWGCVPVHCDPKSRQYKIG
jgi:hypothetical protein